MSATRPPAFDDRLNTPTEASRRGAHRARPKPMTAGLPVVAGIIVVLAVVGGVYTVLGRSPDTASTSKDLAAAGALDSPDPTAPAAGGAPSATTSTKPRAATTTAAPVTTASIDRSVNLVVLNSISVQGLAKRVQSSIENDGWTVDRTDNSRNRNLPTTKIYYGKSSLKATATALRKDLGYGTVVRDSSVATDGLVVVLGQDAQ